MNDVTKRFIDVYNILLSQNKIQSAKDFANKILVSNSMITEIIKGRSNVGITAIQNTVLQFNVNSNWILVGIGEIFNEENAKPPNNIGCSGCDDKNRIIEDLKNQLINTQNEFINLLKNSNLSKEKSPDKSGQKRKELC